MIDREKVIEGLEETEIKLTNALNRSGAMSLMGAFRCLNNVTDAIALLKEQAMPREQEAAKIEVKKINDSGRCGRCPICHVELNETDYPNYCGYCGKKVKWR